MHNEGTVTARTTQVHGRNRSLPPTWDRDPHYRWQLWCHHGPAGGRPGPDCPLPVPGVICPCHHIPPGQTRPMEPEKGLYWGRGGWMGCRGIRSWRGVGVWGALRAVPAKKGKSKGELGASRSSFSPCSTMHFGVTWLTPTLQNCSREGSETSSTLPPLWQVWCQNVGCKVWDAEGK